MVFGRWDRHNRCDAIAGAGGVGGRGAMPAVAELSSAHNARDGTSIRFFASERCDDQTISRVAAAVVGPVEGQQQRTRNWHGSENRTRGGVPALTDCVVLAILVACVAGAIATVRPSHTGATARCQPIRYAIVGAPPAYVIDQFGVATAEITERTRIPFVPAPASTAQLVVSWDPHLTSPWPANELPAGSEVPHLLGSARGAWSVNGERRTFVAGHVALDANKQWEIGIHRDDSLASVMVHELGHVIGVAHASEPASFMYRVAEGDEPSWTATDREELAAVGSSAGCSRGERREVK